MIEDLRWFGFHWNEGPDAGGPFAPYNQSERIGRYRAAFQKLVEAGCVYPCICSRQDVLRALEAPHARDDEPIYPGTCRQMKEDGFPKGAKVNWRFRVPDQQIIKFADGGYGPQEFCAGRDFGDFVVWRNDDVPAYQLACVVDDAEMQITEVVRGEDLLISTARQLLLYRALGFTPPKYFHCPLMLDETGARMAKRNNSMSLRQLCSQGATPERLRENWHNPEQITQSHEH